MKKMTFFLFFTFSSTLLFAQDKSSLNLDILVGNYTNNITKVMGGYRISKDSWLKISKKNNSYNYTLISTTMDEYNNYESRKEITNGSLKLYNNKILFIGGTYGNNGGNILINYQTDFKNGMNRIIINFSKGRGNSIAFEKSTSPIKSAPVFKFKENTKNSETLESNKEKHFDFQFFKDFYRKSPRYDYVNFDEMEYLTGVVQIILPNKYYDINKDDSQAFIDILINNGPGKGQTITVSTSLKKYSSNCNKCVLLIDKLKVGTLLKFKVAQVGNGDGRSFWFTDLTLIN